SVTLNLKSDRGKKIFREMAARADVVVENFAPGVMDRLDLGAQVLHEINPRLIYASSSGYGKTGPYRGYPAMDLVVQAMAGVIDITGQPDQPPVKAGPALCDFNGGVHLYSAVATALFQRERTGRGRVVEVSMMESVYSSMASTIGMFHASGGKGATRTGNRHGGMGISPYNVYPTTDGYVVINCPGDHHFQAVLRVIDREDLLEDPRFLTRSDRVRHMFEVDALMESWTSRCPKAEVAAKLLAASVPCAPVRELGEVMTDENMHARGSLQWVEHPTLGRVVLPHSPIVYEGTERVPLEPSHALGADSEAVFSEWLGLAEEELAELKREEVI
ncbi:MAG: CoA transferase, partial [Rhodospirillum sp.]|nr:CoA transferase [Rhodospirillum sp.]